MTKPQTYSSFRHWEKQNYAHRFSYNGMEKDDEIKGLGTSYDYGARFLDPRVGRFLSLDVFKEKYPWQSPFLYAGDNPTENIDYQGKFKVRFSKTNYPTLTKIVENAYIEAKQNDKVIPGLIKYGHIEDQFNGGRKQNHKDALNKVKNDFSPQKGQIVILEEMPSDFYGFHTDQGKIIINAYWARQLEDKTVSKDIKTAISTHLFYTLCEEYIHDEERLAKKNQPGEINAQGFHELIMGKTPINVHETEYLIRQGVVTPIVIPEVNNKLDKDKSNNLSEQNKK